MAFRVKKEQEYTNRSGTPKKITQKSFNSKVILISDYGVIVRAAEGIKKELPCSIRYARYSEPTDRVTHAIEIMDK